jgi:exonuclease SbcC
MIIRRVAAENVFKYARLDLNDLPPQGTIAISGLNESGKTTIAETICFALFGRTFSLSPSDLDKLIRWGETHCTAAVDFWVSGQSCQVVRHLDDEGHQGVRLSIQGRDEPLAAGPEAVQRVMIELLGYGYEEFTESFYLAQREITATHPHAAAVQAMAGVSSLLDIADELEAEIRKHEEGISGIEGQIADLRRQIDELDLEEERLPALEAERVPLVNTQLQQEHEQQALNDGAARYRDSVPKLRALQKSLLSTGVDTSIRVWRELVANLDSCLIDAEPDPERQNGGRGLTAGLASFVDEAKARLARLEEIRSQGAGYRRYLGQLLGERPAEAEVADTLAGDAAVEPLAERQLELTRRIGGLRRSGGWALTGLIVCLLLAIALWTGWTLLFRAPDIDVSKTLASWLATNVRDWNQTFQPLLLPVALVFTALFAFFGIRYSVLWSRINGAQRDRENTAGELESTRLETDALDNLDALPIADAVATLRHVKDNEVAAAARDFTEGQGADLLEPARLEGYQGRLRELITQYESAVSAACGRIGTKSGVLGEEITTQKERVASVDQSIEEERQRRKTAADLAGMIEALQVKIEERRRRIRVRSLGRELIAGSCREISRLFNRDIRGLVGGTLPLLTQGRYEHLQIDEDLKVRVFSSEKRDFMELEEISSGTQRQIMLAVRLALSQKLINNAHAGAQFVFLDEPFAVYDRERTIASLEALPRVSEQMRQFWVTSQHFPEDFPFDVHIRCAREKADLIL